MKKDETKLVKIESIDTLYQDACQIIKNARSNAVRSVDFCRVQMYWNLGKRIFEEEQQGKERADYGTYLIKNLSKRLKPDYGSGFGPRQLERARAFYRLYPIASALRTQLNWGQYKLLTAIADPDKREYYELESVNNAWTARETERQINSMLYERLLMSNDKESVLAIARKQRIAIRYHLTEFMLELGKGFSFVDRQKRIMLEDEEFFVDLVFYNRLLRCFVIIETKTGKLTHQDLGQLQMYVNYYDRIEKLPDENPTIGILLCTQKNDTLVRMTLPEDNKTILASEYKLYLPTTEQLVKEVDTVKKLAKQKKEKSIPTPQSPLSK